MKHLKGLGLLLISNLLIGIALYVAFLILAYGILPMFGIDLRASATGMILLYALILGFGGAFISLASAPIRRSIPPQVLSRIPFGNRMAAKPR